MMLPVLKSISTRDISGSKDIIADVIKAFILSQEDQAQLLPSKTQRVVDNRVYWCLVYLQRAGLMVRPSRGKYQITPAGQETITKKPEKIDIKYLSQFESFRKFREDSRGTSESEDKSNAEDATSTGLNPNEALEKSYARLKATVCAELLTQARRLDPTDFEKVVVDLLQRMNYGVDPSSVVHRGRSGDGGIDGEISQDPLGLDMIYVQAKRFQEGSGIGRPVIQQFVGSLNEKKAKKGLFITTSHFSSDAVEYVNRVDTRIVLVDGPRLAELMYDYDLGVKLEHKYDVKKLDSDFFEE
jgi:restriction system protein